MEAEDQSLLCLDHYELTISEALPRQSFSGYNCGLLVLSLQFLESPEYVKIHPPPSGLVDSLRQICGVSECRF